MGEAVRIRGKNREKDKQIQRGAWLTLESECKIQRERQTECRREKEREKERHNKREILKSKEIIGWVDKQRGESIKCSKQRD